jgi:hypothetical protein
MENKMKKLIALFAVSAMASTAAVASIALSGTASVSYDDNGSSASATTYDADLTIVGTAGSTTLTYGIDLTTPSTSSTVMATTIGPITVSADMHDETSLSTASGGQTLESTDTGVTVSLDAPIGDATIGLDNSGNITVSGTWAGVTISHTIKDGSDTTTGSASIAGMDVSLTNAGGASTWSIATTVSGVDLTLASSKKITAAFGLAGNTMTVSHIPAVASAAALIGTAAGTGANGYGTNAVTSAAAYSTVAISRDLTSGASLSATYKTSDDSLTLKASVAF